MANMNLACISRSVILARSFVVKNINNFMCIYHNSLITFYVHVYISWNSLTMAGKDIYIYIYYVNRSFFSCFPINKCVSLDAIQRAILSLYSNIVNVLKSLPWLVIIKVAKLTFLLVLFLLYHRWRCCFCICTSYKD